ncbi:medium-chain acyl-CoA ligase ACSF2, mitochondrial-like [Mya arenaria]|uniref:medium-chain acyl-CoA ligase ACSF2, mitochondrial-like n=1 Tax=Mya arenaria TaxID=6604 RepID=UPI0022E714E9|nr:medium-chain acyl-CoA ligase ACSF2, mitochondrial-like [Mya arenaria]
MKKQFCDFKREARPSGKPLTKSYYHAVCETPLSDATIGEVLGRKVLEYPDRIVIKAPEFGQSVTLGELKRKADCVSKALLASGAKKGDYVFLTGVADTEFAVWYFAVVQIGLAILAPVRVAHPESQLAYFWKSKPVVAYIGRDHAQGTKEILKDLQRSHDGNVVLVSHQPADPDFLPYEEFLASGQAIAEQQLKTATKSVSIDDVAYMIASSGTSSTSYKVSAHTHHAMVNLAKFCQQRMRPYTEEEVISIMNPIHDDTCVVTLLGLVMHGDLGVIAPRDLVPYTDCADVFMKFVHENRIVWHSGMPFEFIHTIQSSNREKYDLSSLRGGNLVGQIITKDVKTKLLNTFSDMITMYGATECFVGLSTSVRWSTPEQRLNSIGFPFPHCEVKLVNEMDDVVPIGSQGEICLRGWPILKYYFNDTERTAQTKHPDNNGWHHFGDIGIMDETGHVTYIGRKSEMVIFKHYSEAVSPSFILEVVKKDERVLNAKVVGIPNDIKGDDICLCVEVKNDCHVTEQELRTSLEQEIAYVALTEIVAAKLKKLQIDE